MGQLQKYRTLPLFCILILLPALLGAQEMHRPHYIGFRSHYGFLFQHKLDMDQLVSGHIPSIELYWGKQHGGDALWHHHYNFPQTGLGLQYVDFNNPRAGKAISILPYINFQLAKGKRDALQLRSGWGLGYLTRKFDINTNRKNLAVSSRINAAFSFILEYRHTFAERFTILTGLSLTHFSNGALKIPNAGLNVFGANFAFQHHFGQLQAYNRTPSRPELLRSWQLVIWNGAFPKETEPVNRGKFFAYTVSVGASKLLKSTKGSFSAGLDYSYDGTLKVRRAGVDTPFPARLGLHLGYIMHIGKLSVPFQQGIYLIDKFKTNTPVYQRIGLRYHLTKPFFLTVNLRTHFFTADFIEAGFGIRL